MMKLPHRGLNWLLTLAVLSLGAVLSPGCGQAARVEATAYYVSPTGSDLQSGRTPSAPWKTLAQVNGTKFRPGDQILFQRGGQWRESLVASSSGASGNPIIYGDYGKGTKPKFWGSIVLDKALFTPLGGTCYSYKSTLPIQAVLADHNFLFDSLGQPVESLRHSYSWSDGLLKINSSSDPRVDGRQYSACVREDLIQSHAQSHLVFRNLVTDESAKFGGGYGIRIMDSQDVLVEGCEVYRAGKHHFGCINSTQVVHRDCYAAYAMPRQGPGGHSAYVSFGDNKNLPRQSSEYDNCSFEHTQDTWDGAYHYFLFVTHGPSIGSVLLRDMVSHGAPCSVDNGESGATIKIIGGLLDNSRLELSGKNIVVDGLHIRGAQGTVDISASDCVLQNMVIEGTNLGTSWYQTAVLSRKPRNTVRFCNITMAADAPDFNSCLAVAEQSTDFRYYGNTFVSHGAPLRDWGHSSITEAHDNKQKLWRADSPAEPKAK